MGWAGKFNEGFNRVQEAAGVGNRPAGITAQQIGAARVERTLVQSDGNRAICYYLEMVVPAAQQDLKVAQALNKSRVKRNDLGFEQFESHLKYGESVVANKGKEAVALHELNTE